MKSLLYFTFFFLFSIFHFSTATLFTVFHLPAGFLTIVTQLLLVLLSVAVLVFWPLDTRLPVELTRMLFIAAIWAVYLYCRCDVSDPIALKKFNKLVFVQIVSIFTLTVMFLSDRECFQKNFFPVIILSGLLIAIKSLLSPEKIMYSGEIERLSLDALSPVWLARSFAVTALSLVLIPAKHKYFKYVKFLLAFLFVVAMIPTGSRGPLLSFIVTFAVYVYKLERKTNLFYVATISFVSILLIGSISFLWPYFSVRGHNYLSRNTSAGMFSESGRKMLFSRSLAEFAKKPLLGQGLGQFANSKSNFNARLIRRYSHNLILEIMSETGLLGLCLFLLLLRPGAWLWPFRNGGTGWQYLFYLSLMFSMTSGNINGNNGVVFYAVIARLSMSYK